MIIGTVTDAVYGTAVYTIQFTGVDFRIGILFGGIVAAISWMLLKGFGTRYV